MTGWANHKALLPLRADYPIILIYHKEIRDSRKASNFRRLMTES